LVIGKGIRPYCSCVPVKVLPILVGTSEFMNKGVNDVKFGRLLSMLYFCLVAENSFCVVHF